MNTDRLFFRINAVFCFYVGLILLGKGASQWRNSWLADFARRDLDKYLDLLLRHFAQQSISFAVLAGYVPALLLISLAVSFYLYVYERSRPLSFIALLFGTGLSALWISRRVFGTAMSVMAARYIETTTISPKAALFLPSRGLYYYDSLSLVLSSETSLLAYGLFGLLLLRGRGLEFVVGSLFLASSVSLIVAQVFTPGFRHLETAGLLLIPAVAFVLSSFLFWVHRPSAEPWMEDA